MSAHRFGVQSRRPRGLPSVHSRGPQKKTAAQRPPSLHSWVIVIAHIRFQGSGPSVPSQPAHASSPLCLHASDDPSSQAARRIVAPIGCRAKWRRTRSCTARLHAGASWPGVSCRMLPPESSGNEAGRRPQRHPPATALLPCPSGRPSSAAFLPSSGHRAEGIRPRREASRRATVSRHACDTMSPRIPTRVTQDISVGVARSL